MKYKISAVTILVILLIVASFYTTIQFIQPSPKKEITIATGSITGAYYRTALEYKRLLEEENVKVTIITSAGSLENIKLIKQNKADIAFVQNGTITNKEINNIKSLASIYYEPLWVFYKNDGYPIDYVIQLISKKISIGKKGSGTRNLSLNILGDNGINKTNSTILNYSSQEAKEELIKGNIDAMFIVTNHNSKVLKELLENPKISLISFKRSKAYSRKYSYLEALTLYEGTLDLYKNIPNENINLLATSANLIVRDNFSDELIRLFIKKIRQVHNKKDLFAKAEQFPNTLNMDLEMNEEAKKYFKNGDTWLEKIFPYWIASNIDRLKILIIPLLTLLFPLFKGVVPLYNWSMRSKIYKWYEEVKKVDTKINNLDDDELNQKLKKLNKLDEEIEKETKVPLSYMGEYYNLQLHIEHVKHKLKKSQ